MSENMKWIYKATVYPTVGLGLVTGSVLTSISATHLISKKTTPQNNTDTVFPNLTNHDGVTFKIRSNPTNGFNGLTTANGRYTYVLITNIQAFSPENVGGHNSGIACIDTQTGQSIGEWYLPQWDDFASNYTTNIVFGQKTEIIKNNDGTTTTKTVFDESKLFVLCGICNLAQAINTVYDNYVSETAPKTQESDAHQIITFKPKVSSGPTIKIFKLKIAFDGDNATYTNALGKNIFGADKFYNFAYPSDGTNGYAGFNVNGVPYDMQAVYGYKTSAGDGNEVTNPGYLPDDINQSLYVAKDLDFTINRDTPITQVPNKNTNTTPAFGINNGDHPNHGTPKTTFAGAFGSYLTYLTYGQNFAYHLGEKYKNSNDYYQKDEFIMTTSFINVDRNIGGLYSTIVANNGAVDYQSTIDGYPEQQSNWPVPFGYQWVLADIANTNKQQAIDEAQTPGSQTSIQYSYVDANGEIKDVRWGDNLALTAPIINFLNDQIFPLKTTISNNGQFSQDQLGNLYSALQINEWCGANWGATTGYIIYTPIVKALPGEANKFAPDKNEYRYYHISAIAIRPTDDQDAFIEYISASSYSSFIFTNLLATDNLTYDGSLSYLMTISYTPGKALFLQHDQSVPQAMEINVSPFTTLFTSIYTSMFCYDWDSISNDNGANDLIEPIPITDQTTFGYLNNTRFSDLKPDPNLTEILLPSFNNWNLVFLGGPSLQGIGKMDASFTVAPECTHNSIAPSDANALDLVFLYWMHHTDPANRLSQDLTFLRRKIAFVVHPHNGFVYFTAGNAIDWIASLSFWDVRSFDGIELSHNKHNVGTVFLSTEQKASFDQKVFHNPDQAIWDIKTINQPFGNGGPTLAFIMSNGIYTASGAKMDAYKHLSNEFYYGSVNNFLAECGDGATYLGNNLELFSAIAFTPFVVDQPINEFSLGPITPNVMLLNDNFLDVITGAEQTKWQVQNNEDYLILANNTTEPKIPGVFNDPTKVPPSLQHTPAAKPLLNVNDYAIDDNEIHLDLKNPTNPEEKLTFEQILNDKLEHLYTTILGLKLDNPNYAIEPTYNVNKFGPVVVEVKDGQESDLVDAAKILIPVTFPNFIGYTDIVYYAPIKKGVTFSSSYNLTGLWSQPFVPVFVVLKTKAVMQKYLRDNKLTANDLYMKYGSKTYDSALASEFDANFVDIRDTKDYISKHIKFFGDTFTYWVKLEEPLSTNSTHINLKVWYKFKPDQEWKTDGNLCTQTDYNNGNPKQDNLTKLFPLESYQLPRGNRQAFILILSISATVVVVALCCGFGIGIPMRKQRRINLLQAKITGQNIDDLSANMSNSFKEVIRSAMSIDQKVGRIENTFDWERKNITHSLSTSQRKTSEKNSTKPPISHHEKTKPKH